MQAAARRRFRITAAAPLVELDGAPERYAPANPIWRHPDSGGTLFVGNASIAGDRQALAQLQISRIVFCQDSDGRMTFAKDPAFKYLKFSIGWPLLLPRCLHHLHLS